MMRSPPVIYRRPPMKGIDNEKESTCERSDGRPVNRVGGMLNAISRRIARRVRGDRGWSPPIRRRRPSEPKPSRDAGAPPQGCDRADRNDLLVVPRSERILA